MQNLRVWQKLALIAAVFMLPFAGVTYKMTSSIRVLGVDFAEQELRGLEYYTPVLALLRDLQQHRDMTAAWLSGDASFKAPLAAKAGDLRADIKAIDEVDRRLDSALHTSTRWAALSASCRELLDRDVPVSAADSFARHTQALEDTIALITAVGRYVETHARSRPRQLLPDERARVSGSGVERAGRSGPRPRDGADRRRDADA